MTRYGICSIAPIVLVLFLTTAALGAAPVYVNGAPNVVSGNEATENLQAEDFVLDRRTMLTAARIWAFYWDDPLSGFLGSLEWSIRADAGGLPGGILFSGIATPIVGPGAPACCDSPITVRLEIPLPDLTLDAGAYWLTIHNGPSSETSFEEFFWQTADDNSTRRGLRQAVPFGVSPWIDSGFEHAFELDGHVEGEVPEPATLGLTGLALVGWGHRTPSNRRVVRKAL